MALIECPECQKQVSDQAAACPSCGHPIAARDDYPRGLMPSDLNAAVQAEKRASKEAARAEKRARKELARAERGGSGIGCFLAILIIAVVGALLLISGRDETALRSSTDPAEIARLVLNQSAAHSSAAIDGDRFVMTYSLAPWSLTSGTTIIAFEEHMAELVPLIFRRFPKVDRIDVSATGKFSDKRGNSFEHDAIRMMLTRRNASTIQWDKINHANIPKLADQYWVHPSLTN